LEQATRWQKKVLTTNTALSNNPTFTSIFTFNGLVTGKTYRLTTQIGFSYATTATSAIVRLAGGITGNSPLVQPVHATGHEDYVNLYWLVTANSSSVTIEAAGNLSTATALGTTGGRERSSAFLEELGSYTETTAFT
jgi:hypothetical protein